MALYKYAIYLTTSNDAAFDATYAPGSAPQHSGIYRCSGCGREVTGEVSRTLPPQNHHQHTNPNAPIRWNLAVYADGRPK
jgi:hypothetical protein